MDRIQPGDLREGSIVRFELETSAPYVGFCWGNNFKEAKEGKGERYIATNDADILFCSTDPHGCTSKESPLRDRLPFLGLNLARNTLGNDTIIAYEILRRNVG